MTNESLKDLFSQYGEIVSAEVIIDRATGRSKGFGFVAFTNEADAQKAISEMNEKEMEGRKIIVNIAKPREERAPGDRGGFRRDDRNRR